MIVITKTTRIAADTTTQVTRVVNRVDRTCRLVRNGSYIQIEFERNGLPDTILVREKDLKKILKTSQHGEKFYGVVNFDEEITDG